MLNMMCFKFTTKLTTGLTGKCISAKNSFTPSRIFSLVDISNIRFGYSAFPIPVNFTGMSWWLIAIVERYFSHFLAIFIGLCSNFSKFCSAFIGASNLISGFNSLLNNRWITFKFRITNWTLKFNFGDLTRIIMSRNIFAWTIS